MEKLDAVVAAVGAVVLVVALGGAAFYGGSVTMDTYVVTFSTADEALASEEGAATGDGATATYDVATMNVTEVTVEVTFTGTNPVRATGIPLVVVVEGPDNLTGQAEGTLAGGASAGSTTLTVTVPVASVPDERRIDAANVEAAISAADAASALGMGSWSVTARADAGLSSEQVTATIAPTLVFYVASAAPETPPAPR